MIAFWITRLDRLAMFALALNAVTHCGASANDIALGEYLAGECVTCHQISGESNGIPPIVGLPRDAFVKILGAYKTGARDNEVMKTIAARLSDNESQALAAYFESLSPKK